jgi:thiol:disulfide interchange protein DsbA
MMVKALLGAVSGALIAAQVWAFDEGIDYTELTRPQPTESKEKIEVLEVFMYSCPHCFHLEPTITKWLETKPKNVEFRRMPAVFGPKAEPHARAFYAAELIGKGEQFHEPLFRALHLDKQSIWDEDALVAFAEQQGIDGEEFRKAYKSFFVDMRVRRSEEMVKRYGVDGVPTFIVNGKYRTSPSQTGGRDKMLEVINYLIGVESDSLSAKETPPTSPGDSSS